MEYSSNALLLETKSMEIIAAYYYLNGRELTPAETKIYSRIIHTSGDPDYANHIRFIRRQSKPAARRWPPDAMYIAIR